MLTPEFKAQLDHALPEQPVTGIVSWNIRGLKFNDRELLSGIGRLKQPLLKRLESVAGVRINPLPGMPQAIVQASAAAWRTFLRDDTLLRDKDGIEVAANLPDFHTLDVA